MTAERRSWAGIRIDRTSAGTLQLSARDTAAAHVASRGSRLLATCRTRPIFERSPDSIFDHEVAVAQLERMPMLSAKALARDVRCAKAEANNRFRDLRAARFNPEADSAKAELFKLSGGFFKFFDGNELDDAHAGTRGMSALPGRKRAYYLECRVGEAHVGDPQRAGSRRLVLKVDSLQVKRMFLTDAHYTRGSWSEIQIG